MGWIKTKKPSHATHYCPFKERPLLEKPSALKREHPALNKLNLFTFLTFLGPFCPPGS
jgi:hypothetical protein